MNSMFNIVFRSLWFYRRTNAAVALGVAAATAVLAGALIIGDSMRGSLRQLTIERLGKIDELIISEGFFSANLADHLTSLPAFQKHYSAAESAILFPSGSVEIPFTRKRAGQVTVLGIRNRFWEFGVPQWTPKRELTDDTAIINQALADHLGITESSIQQGSVTLTVRIPKQHQLPADSPMSKQDDLIESLVDLQVIEMVPSAGLGRFGLYPSQGDPLNVYLSISRLQESLEQTVLKHKSDPQQANLILLSGKEGIPGTGALDELLQQTRPPLEDFGLTLKRITTTFTPLFRDPTSADDIFDVREETIFDYTSLSTERLVFSNSAATVVEQHLPDAKPVFTYLANDIRPAVIPSEPSTDPKRAVPFSMVAAIDFDDTFAPVSSSTSQPIAPLADDEIVLVEWAATDLGVNVGDVLELRYFEPETTHGNQVERTVPLKLADVAKLTEPVSGYVTSRRGGIEPAKFSQRPEITNDPDLTPEVPGVTDAESIDRWDLPFETASKIRPQDDQYWNDHRTTPKAYVSLTLGQRLWNSRFGKVTSYRIPPSDPDALGKALIPAVANEATHFGFQALPIKQRGLEASAGSTPFDILFLALSMFVIGSALILVALLFRLSFQQRASEVGILSAIGWSQANVRWIWMAEMSLIVLAGAGLGVLLGIGYASLMIWGLSTWWVDAISSPFLELHLRPLAMTIGLLSGWLVSTLTIAWSLRGALKQNTRNLLAGQIEKPSRMNFGVSRQVARRDWLIGIVVGLIVMAFGLTLSAVKLSGEAQAGAFMGAGFLVLFAGLVFVYRMLSGRGSARASARQEGLSLFRLALMNAQRNPLRSTLTIGLVAVASFLIAAVSAFRLSPTEQGTGGFDWVAQSSQPILFDLSTADGRLKLLGTDRPLRADTTIIPIRYQVGEDASCNNLYQSTQPQILGLPQRFIDQFQPDDRQVNSPQFAWAGSLATSEMEKENPWLLLTATKAHQGTADDPIPTVLDKNTANYSLKIYRLNSVLKVEYDSGRSVHFRVVGFLSNTILQGSLLIGENDFVSAFPSVGGYQYFLIRENDGTLAGESQNQNKNLNGAIARLDQSQKSADINRLEERLSDYGFEARSAPMLLGNFLKVQNTYLSTFQTLGSLGLLLGTFGLAVVQMRAILERKRELGLLRAVGFSQTQLSRLVLIENLILLGLGLAVGIGAALFTTLPHGWLGNAAIPWFELGAMFGLIGLVGLLASSYASAKLGKIPLLESLRN